MSTPDGMIAAISSAAANDGGAESSPSWALVRHRYRRLGWSLEEALLTPTGGGYRRHREARPERVVKPRRKLQRLWGRHFDALIVEAFGGRDERGRPFWWCRCKHCGCLTRKQHSNLLSERVGSCGQAECKAQTRRARRAVAHAKEIAA